MTSMNARLIRNTFSFNSLLLTQTGALMLLIWCCTGFTCGAHAQEYIVTNLGCGEPGLHISYTSTNRSIIYIDEPWSAGDAYFGGMGQRKVQILYSTEPDPCSCLWGKEMSKWKCDPVQLYPFDETCAFTTKAGHWNENIRNRSGGSAKWEYWPRETQLFTTNTDGLALGPTNVYELAIQRYGLASNQLFLGKIGSNVFFWETQNPTRAYYRNAEVPSAPVSYFKLPGTTVDIYGATKGDKQDVGFVIFRKTAGLFAYSPYTIDFAEFNYQSGTRLSSKP